jgi:high-affinity Fe2+/Pb2+ permease
MRFLPVISISLGFFVFFILSVISLVSFNILSLAGFILLLILIVFAGFLATYLAEEKKMRYQ